MKRKVLAIITAIMIITAPLSVNATDVSDTEVTDEVTEETDTEVAEETESQVEASEDEDGVMSGFYMEDEEDGTSIFDTEGEQTFSIQDMPEGEGLDGAVVEVTNIPASKENNAQVTFTADVPEGFDANIYAEIQNVKTSVIYSYALYAQNTYTQRGYVPDGEYRVIETGVFDDVNGMFLFNPVDDFKISNGGVKGITLSLANESEVIDLINGRIPGEEEVSDNKAGFTKSDYVITHTGTGDGVVAMTGEAAQGFTLFIRIVRGGVPGDMAIDLSVDDGATYIAQAFEIPLSGVLDLGGGINVIFEVPDGGSFVADDTYRCVVQDPARVLEYDEKTKGSVKMRIIDENPDVNVFDKFLEYGFPSLELRINKGGEFGEAIVSYSIGNLYQSEEVYLPDSGILPIEGTTLFIELYTDSTSYAVLATGDSFTATPAKIKEENKSLMPIIIVLLIIFGGAFLAVVLYFKLQMTNAGSYTLREYTPVKRPEKKRKKR